MPAGLWACAKCGTDNPPQTKFCFKCAAQLVRACPECKAEASLVATGVCGKCGYHYDVASRRQEIRQQIPLFQKELVAAQQEFAAAEFEARKEALDRRTDADLGLLLSVLLVVTGFLIGCIALLNSALGASMLGFLMFLGGLFWFVRSRASWRLAKQRAQETAAIRPNTRVGEVQEQLRQLQAEFDATTRSTG
jgi:ribosomal protein L40E